jgi:hypothetical protein
VVRIFDIGGLASLIALRHTREEALSACAVALPLESRCLTAGTALGALAGELRVASHLSAEGVTRRYAENAADIRTADPDVGGRRRLECPIDAWA